MECLICAILTQSNRKVLDPRQGGVLQNYRRFCKDFSIWITTDLLAWYKPFAVLEFFKLLNFLNLTEQILFLTSSLNLLNNENLGSGI
jgi:hypothetical protein